MAYTNKQDQYDCQRRWYERNRASVIAHNKENARLKRQWLSDYKKKLKCKYCPENHIACLDFHHRDASQKEINISRARTIGWSIERIKKEIAKCDVICSNCHRKHHYDENASVA
jgi:hypothetical protein